MANEKFPARRSAASEGRPGPPLGPRDPAAVPGADDEAEIVDRPLAPAILGQARYLDRYRVAPLLDVVDAWRLTVPVACLASPLT